MALRGHNPTLTFNVAPSVREPEPPATELGLSSLRPQGGALTSIPKGAATHRPIDPAFDGERLFGLLLVE